MNRTIIKIFISTIAGLTLVSSCNKEYSLPEDRLCNLEIRAGLPVALQTYTGGEIYEGGMSNLGGAYNLNPDKYDLRFVMEAWTSGNPRKLAARYTETVDRDFANASVKFKAKLIAAEYDLLFWADFVPQGQNQDYIYKTDSEQGLMSVSISGDRAAGNEYADAYYASKHVDLNESGENIGNIQLARPFGKIRIIATDEIDSQLPDYPGRAIVEYGNGVSLPNTFNVLTGIATGTMNAGKYEFKTYVEKPKVSGYDQIENAYIIGSDYIFASDATTSYSFTITVYSSENQDRKIGEKTLSEIPLEENKLTTLIGNFYSSKGNIEIIISDAFIEDENIDNRN